MVGRTSKKSNDRARGNGAKRDQDKIALLSSSARVRQSHRALVHSSIMALEISFLF